MKASSSGRLVAVLLTAIVQALCATCAWSEQPTLAAELKKAPAPQSKWKTYVNEKYGFEFRYPAGSKVKTRDDTGYKYIRVQNYKLWTLQPGLGPFGADLRPQEFFLEIFITDPALGHRREGSCAERLKDDSPKVTRRDKIVVYTGRDDEPPGDAGGYCRLLCTTVGKVQILVRGTEGSIKAPKVTAILKSFKLGK
jgi:hypothetical protein